VLIYQPCLHLFVLFVQGPIKLSIQAGVLPDCPLFHNKIQFPMSGLLFLSTSWVFTPSFFVFYIKMCCITFCNCYKAVSSLYIFLSRTNLFLIFRRSFWILYVQLCLQSHCTKGKCCNHFYKKLNNYKHYWLKVEMFNCLFRTTLQGSMGVAQTVRTLCLSTPTSSTSFPQREMCLHHLSQTPGALWPLLPRGITMSFFEILSQQINF